MASKLESDVIALVRKLIADGKIFSISLVDPDSPAVKKAPIGGLGFAAGCAECNDDKCIERMYEPETGRCTCLKCR